jgi:peptidase M23-like protein
MRRSLLVSLVLISVLVPLLTPARAAVPWSWPVTGAIVRGFDRPDSPYGTGHRGIDIAAAVGTTVRAPDDGVVSFAGPVGGRLFVTIDHGGGVTSTASWLTSLLVRKGAHVVRGQAIAMTGWGHPDLAMPHLHFSVRLNGTYVDPLAYLGPLDVSLFIRLAPLEQTAAAPTAAGRMTALASGPFRVVRRVGRHVGGGSGVRTGERRSLAAVPAGAGPRGNGGHGARPPVHRVVAVSGGDR